MTEMKTWFRSHPDEEQLILYYYGEDSGDATERHLVRCARCRVAYEALGEVLAAASAATVPERPGDYGAWVWARLEPRLPAVRRQPEPRGERHGWQTWLAVPRWRERSEERRVGKECRL